MCLVKCEGWMLILRSFDTILSRINNFTFFFFFCTELNSTHHRWALARKKENVHRKLEFKKRGYLTFKRIPSMDAEGVNNTLKELSKHECITFCRLTASIHSKKFSLRQIRPHMFESQFQADSWFDLFCCCCHLHPFQIVFLLKSLFQFFSVDIPHQNGPSCYFWSDFNAHPRPDYRPRTEWR